MAEAVALIRATDHLLENEEFHLKKINLWSDSQSVIHSLASVVCTNPLIAELMDNIIQLNEKAEISINWIKAHAGHMGNEMADMLAKKGADAPPITPSPAVWNPMSTLKKMSTKYIEDKWNKRWPTWKDGRHSKEMLPKLEITLLPQTRKPLVRAM